jgi:hypothetical protein
MQHPITKAREGCVSEAFHMLTGFLVLAMLYGTSGPGVRKMSVICPVGYTHLPAKQEQTKTVVRLYAYIYTVISFCNLRVDA